MHKNTFALLMAQLKETASTPNIPAKQNISGIDGARQ